MVTEMKLTKEMLQAGLPTKQAGTVNTSVVDHVNKILTDPDERKYFRENLINYNIILQEGRYKVNDYIAATMYISFKMLNYSNIDAFARTFPDRMDRYKKENKSIEEINNFVSGYNRTKLVTSLLQKAKTPTWILNQDVHQEAINTLAEIMRNPRANEMARVKAASDLMTYLTPPEESAIKLEIGIEGSFLDNMQKAMRDLAVEQQKNIASGKHTTNQIASTRIIDAEVVEVI